MRKGSANKRIYKWARLSDSGRAAAPALPPIQIQMMVHFSRCTLVHLMFTIISAIHFTIWKNAFFKEKHFRKVFKNQSGGICTFNY